MPTFLFDKIIFGPVKSRRLGVSLGVNLLPTNRKICSFDCIYCECGLNTKSNTSSQLPSFASIIVAMESKLQEMVKNSELPDVITYAGNGEPTLHPRFADIIDATIELRNKYAPKARIAVLSNATRIQKPDIFNALLKVDDNIQKLDSGLINTIQLLDQPVGSFDLDKTVEQLQNFKGKVVIQTMLTKGVYNGNFIDNTSEKDINSWLRLIEKIKPQKVMLYTIDRATPIDTLEKISLELMNQIAQKVNALGIETQVSG